MIDEKNKDVEDVEKQFGDDPAAQQRAETLEAEAATLAAEESFPGDPLAAEEAAEFMAEEVMSEDAPANKAGEPADKPADKPEDKPEDKPAHDAPVPPHGMPRHARHEAAAAPAAPMAAHAERPTTRLGRRRALKVYHWLGFIGGAFAVALGFMLLFTETPDASIAFRGDFYTAAYQGIAQITSLLKLGFFGLLEVLGLGLLGAFGPRLLKDDARE